MDAFTFVKEKLFDFSRLTINRGFGPGLELICEGVRREEGRQVFVYGGSRMVSVCELSACLRDNTVLLSIRLELTRSLIGLNQLSAQNALAIGFSKNEPDELTASMHDGNIWWMMPHFGKTYSDIPEASQGLLARFGEYHCHILPLLGDQYLTLLGPNGLSLSTAVITERQLSGPMFAVTVSKDPYDAISENYANARAMGGIRVPLRCERAMPSFSGGFGWCTWDAFRQDVSEKLIFEKLREFHEKHVPVHYVIIDDGWLSVKDGELTDFEADPVKFPNGLAGCVRRIKEEFGVPYVGVWHTLTGGYWNGIREGSNVFISQRNNLVHTATGLWIQNPDPDIGFAFWDSFHGFLSRCGIDFVKVDNQSSAVSNMFGFLPVASAISGLQEGLDRSVKLHFNSDMINCMGMDEGNVLARPFSGLSRNSDDFYPAREGSFGHHLIQNVYNALWHGQIYHCDFDMWWSTHPDAYLSAVLRAVSGSPVYVSDGIGGTNAELLTHIIDSDGGLPFFDGPAQPTADLLYIDCRESVRLQKIWNRCGDNYVLAVFNIGTESLTETFTLNVIPGLCGDSQYYVDEFFSGMSDRKTSAEEIQITLPPNQIALYSFYPIRSDERGEYILHGPKALYASAASKHTFRYDL